MTFPKGLTISVQWGGGNYCQRRNTLATLNDEMNTPFVRSTSAEIAIIDSEGNFFNFIGGQPISGWCTPEEVAYYIMFTSLSINFDQLSTFINEWNETK
jgi:hypothetical protein